MNRIDRLVGIMLVLQSRSATPVGDLVERFEVSRRTIYRDLLALAEAGFPLANHGSGYGVPDGFRLPPLTLTSREATALLMGAEFVRAHTDPALKAAAETAIAKIEATLPAPVRSYAQNMMAYLQLRRTRRVGRRYQEDNIFALQKAIADRRALHIRYDRGSKGEISERIVEPLGMIFSADHWYVVAHCRSRGDVRVFRTDRILGIDPLDETFIPPAGFSLATQLKEDDGQQEDFLIELKVSPALAQRLHERMPFRIVSEKKVDHHISMTLRTFGVDHATHLVLSMGSEAEVVRPANARQSVIQEVETLRTFYTDDGAGPAKLAP